MWCSTSEAKIISLSSASEKGIDSLAVRLIPTIGQSDNFRVKNVSLVSYFYLFFFLYCIKEDMNKFTSKVLLLLLFGLFRL